MIDVSFDVYSDTPIGQDPDQRSVTLRRYHAALWSKPLPDGSPFALSTKTAGAYLHAHTASGDIILASDSIGHTYRNSKPVADVLAQVPVVEVDSFFALASTIGAYTVFPGRKIDRRPTINIARGLHPKIGDRIDLTLECIKRHYSGDISPLSQALARYDTFFELFGDFKGYVEFFLFQDIVDLERGRIEFFLPYTGFESEPYPRDLPEYRTYRDAMTSFISGRNKRITEVNIRHSC